MSLSPEKSPVTSLFEQVQDSLLSTGTQGYLNKVEITREAELTYEMILGRQRRWYRWQDGYSDEIGIEKDRKLPLATWYAGLADQSEIDVLSFRPGKRLTLLDRRGHKPHVIKGFRASRFASMVARYELAHDALAGTAVRAPEIIEHDYENASLIMVCDEGDRLRLSYESSDVFHDIGEALRCFQDTPTTVIPDEFHSADELVVLGKRVKRMAAAGVEAPAGYERLFERLTQAQETLPGECLALAHRDLHDKQFVAHPHYLTLLDFDLLCLADNALDAANLLAHLVLRQLQDVQGATQASIDRAGKKLISGLERNAETGFWERLRFYQATTFSRLALVYSLRPRWTGLVPDLVVMGHRCLDDLEKIGRQK
ncbi:MAG: aminoglycoside phosphotransferase family protein [Gammaproteobacteria bacterium]|nr:aminoglycoside phosphotransferase family protein [Gammaproteobacteria bacterium]